MYETYFGLTERPFSIAPDPQYLYMSKRHKEAMAHLSYGLTQGGCFIVLTGEVGTGKTTLCRNLLGELPDNVDVALLLNANINELELLQSICDELKIAYSEQSSQKRLLDSINQHLLTTFSENRHTVLIIDEAQILSRDVLEQIRLLTNLETTKSKLLQIILIGQPELNDLLTRNDLRQLAQRVTARYHLGALHRSEIEDYVNFRLSVAGCKQPLFSRQALNKLHSFTDGIPRRINVLADHALLATYAKTASLVDAKTVSASADDVFIKPSKHSSQPIGVLQATDSLLRSKWLVIGVALLLFNVLLWWGFSRSNEEQLDLQSSSVSVISESKSELMNETGDQTSTQETADSQTAILAKLPEDPQTVQSTEPIQESNEGEITSGAVVFSEVPLDASPELPKELREAVVNQLSNESTNQLGTVSVLSAPSDQAELVNNPQAIDSDLQRLLETSADKTSRINAFRKLTELWGQSLPGQLLQPACVELESVDLKCLGFADWQQWQRYNRPAVLVLSHQQQLHRVVVTKLDEESATVLVGELSLTVPSDELGQMWAGQGVVFVKPLPDGTPFLQLGDTGPEVVTARRILNQAFLSINFPVLRSADNPEFDLDMAQKLFALQSRFNIVADSKIGNETWLLMDEILRRNNQLVLRRRV